MKIDRIDHIVLTVKDIEKTCEFYSRLLGMDVVTFGQNRLALGSYCCLKMSTAMPTAGIVPLFSTQ